MGFLKGSQQAIDHMAKIRAMKGGNKKKSNQISSIDTNNNNNIEQTKSKRGRLVKGSSEAIEYMAMLRSKRK